MRDQVNTLYSVIGVRMRDQDFTWYSAIGVRNKCGPAGLNKSLNMKCYVQRTRTGL